ncbi:hypothetical protein HMPREF1531_01723 [Propionibacterium sp. oral taxon 192 str. F0372]|nr:hypothetical protein HMPREF1531_01723 [Propionibacterium sp. oral taxon 192 str. F0372]
MRDESERRADIDWLYQKEPESTPKTPNPPPAAALDPTALPSATLAQERSHSPGHPAPVEAPASRRPRPVPAPHPNQENQTRSVEEQVRRTAPTPVRTDPSRRPSRRRRRASGARRTIRFIGLVLAAWLLFLIGTPIYWINQMKVVDDTPAGGHLADQSGTAILLVGSDAREGLESARTDTIMLLYLPPKGRSVLVSLPRDSYVPIAGYGQGKLNSAYAMGGPALLEQTVEAVTGVRIDGYYEIGFDGFSELVDVVGGVEICPETPINDELSGLNVPAGCQQINGTTALAYVRMRYSDPEGDIGRAKRQREITSKVMAKIATPTSVLNPFRYWNLGRAGSGMLARGKDTGAGDLAATVLGLANVSNGEGLSLVVPIKTTEGWTDDGQSVVIWNSEQAIQLFDEISRGDTSNLDRFAA